MPLPSLTHQIPDDEDEYDQVADYIDYGAIDHGSWEVLQTQSSNAGASNPPRQASQTDFREQEHGQWGESSRIQARDPGESSQTNVTSTSNHPPSQHMGQPRRGPAPVIPTSLPQTMTATAPYNSVQTAYSPHASASPHSYHHHPSSPPAPMPVSYLSLPSTANHNRGHHHHPHLSRNMPPARTSWNSGSQPQAMMSPSSYQTSYSTPLQASHASSHHHSPSRLSVPHSHPPVIPSLGLVCPRHGHAHPPGVGAPVVPIPQQPSMPTAQPTHARSAGHVSPHYHPHPTLFSHMHAPSGHVHPISLPRGAPHVLSEVFPQHPTGVPPRPSTPTWNRAPAPTLNSTYNESQESSQWRSSNGPPPSTIQFPSSPPRNHLPRSSSQSSNSDSSFYDDDGFGQQGPDFYAQLDALERDLNTRQAEGAQNTPRIFTSRSDQLMERVFSVRLMKIQTELPTASTSNEVSSGSSPAASSPKRARSDSIASSGENEQPSTKKLKGKGKAVDDAATTDVNVTDSGVREVLEGLDEEVSCAICCEVIVCAQAVNPCGHSLCGSCGTSWFIQNKKTTCPMCRTKTDFHRPMIPNLLVDNVIQKHIACLAALGDEGWREGGKKMAEFLEREREYKRKAGQPKKAQPPRRSGPAHRAVVVTDAEPDPDVPDWRLVQLAHNQVQLAHINHERHPHAHVHAMQTDWIRRQLLMQMVGSRGA